MKARIAAAAATKEQNNFSLQSNILSYGWPAFGMAWIRKADYFRSGLVPQTLLIKALENKKVFLIIQEFALLYGSLLHCLTASERTSWTTLLTFQVTYKSSIRRILSPTVREQLSSFQSWLQQAALRAALHRKNQL